MKIFIPVDDSYGLMFNNRRQSQDEKLREFVLKKLKQKTLWMNEYTKKQFKDNTDICIKVNDAFMDSAASDEFCFVENIPLNKYEEKIESIFLCKWNRKYPGDVFFDIKLDNGKWKLESVEEIVGKSHEKITIEEWVRL